MDGVGPNGEIILDYSVEDAIRAGFGKVVFVIRHSFENEFKARLYQLDEDGLKEFDALQEKEIEYKPETKQAILDVFRKMDEFGYDKEEFGGEEQVKVYALRKYDNARIEFEKAINSTDPVDKLKAVDAAEKMVSEHTHTKELLDMIHSSFLAAGDQVFYPGNLDLFRNNRIPPEFRDDVPGVSTLNGLYLTYRLIKQLGVSPEEFVNAPKGVVTKKAQAFIDGLNLNKALAGKSGADAITEVAKEKHAIIDMATASLLSRTIETMAKLENDPEMAKNNALAEYGYTMSTAFLLDEINERQDVYDASINSLDRFLLVKEPQENADLLRVPVFDFDGTKRVGEVKYFDEAQYLIDNTETPEEFVERMNGEMVKAFDDMQANFGKTRLTTDALVDAFSMAASKYAIALPKDKQVGEAYKQIKEMATNANKYIEKKLTDAVARGAYKHDPKKIDFSDGPSNPHVIRGFVDYMKSAQKAQQRAAKPVLTADERLNNEIRQIDKEVETLRKQGVMSAADSRKADELLARRSALISERKEALLDAYAEGRVPKEYVERRTEQLDKGPFDKNVPLFEADKPISRTEFQSKLIREGKFVNTNEAYAKYTREINDKKRAFFLKSYMEQEELTQKEKKPTREEREQVRNAQAEKAAERQANVKDGMSVENISVNIDEEDLSAEKGNKEKELDDDIVPSLDDDDDLVPPLEEDGERMEVNLDEEEPELNNDILSFGKEKEKTLDDNLKK